MNEVPVLVVVGSLNVDQTLRVVRLPALGETALAHEALTCFGGKGANQAIAAARAGGQVRMIGCVGNDEHGRSYGRHLEDEGIDTRGVVAVESAPTGTAFITVEDSGENTIVVNPGANHALTRERLSGVTSLFEGAAVVLLQLECPLDAVHAAAELAKAVGATVILNPSPWDDRVREAGIAADIVIVNESEARCLFGRELGSLLEDEGRALGELSCETVIVTRGGEATLVVSRQGVFEAMPPQVSPVDTVGAGDTFAGAFAVANAEGRALLESVEFANAAAALATLQVGAQSAIPNREQIREFQAR